tara:strand:+ start:215 stop:901 length:687 start_codon:yes stop_codon:yes gene_type:complete
MNILCIIPARSGSKGIKNKNLQKIKKNKSLIELAFDIAKKSELFDKIIVSTDSKYYQKILKKKIPIDFLRPKMLSGDKVNDLDVMKFELTRYQKFYQKKFDAVCLLQPTSPFRRVSDLKSCYKSFKKNKLDAVWTVSKIDNKYHPIKILKSNKRYLTYHDKDGSKFINRQSLSEIFIRNGIAYFFSTKTILIYKSILPKKSGYLIINRKIVNIDTPQDLLMAKELIKK